MFSWCIFFIKLNQAVETLKTFEKKDSRVKSAAATNLSFLYFLVRLLASVFNNRLTEIESFNKSICFWNVLISFPWLLIRRRTMTRLTVILIWPWTQTATIQPLWSTRATRCLSDRTTRRQQSSTKRLWGTTPPALRPCTTSVTQLMLDLQCLLSYCSPNIDWRSLSPLYKQGCAIRNSAVWTRLWTVSSSSMLFWGTVLRSCTSWPKCILC